MRTVRPMLDGKASGSIRSRQFIVRSRLLHTSGASERVERTPKRRDGRLRIAEVLEDVTEIPVCLRVHWLKCNRAVVGKRRARR